MNNIQYNGGILATVLSKW